MATPNGHNFVMKTLEIMSRLINPTSQLQRLLDLHFGFIDPDDQLEAFKDLCDKSIQLRAAATLNGESSSSPTESQDELYPARAQEVVAENSVKLEDHVEEPAPRARSPPRENTDKVLKDLTISELLKQVIAAAEQHDISSYSLEWCDHLYSQLFSYEDKTELAQIIENCRVTCTAPAIDELASAGLAILGPIADSMGWILLGGLHTVDHLVSFVHFTRVIIKHNELFKNDSNYRGRYHSVHSSEAQQSDLHRDLELLERLDAIIDTSYYGVVISELEWKNAFLLGKKICKMIDTFGDGILIRIASSGIVLRGLNSVDIETVGRVNNSLIDKYPDLAHIYAPWNGLLLGRTRASKKYSAERAQALRNSRRRAREIIHMLNPDRIGIRHKVEDTGDDIEMEG